MNPTDGDREDNPRRSFLLSSGAALTGAWLASNWPAVAAAAHHAEQTAELAEPAGFDFLSAVDAADVEAIAAQIVPSGKTAGAREAHAVHFIDRALSTFFAAWAPNFRTGLAEFQAAFRAANPASASFAGARPEDQFSHLKTVDGTPFFDGVRTLTVLGMFSSPKYGGNYRGAGWDMMGFKDQHAFTPPFGYYDAEYTGFVPYATEKHS